MPRRIPHGIELLADPTRRSIVGAIAIGIRHPWEIAQRIGLSRPATSRQLRLLVEAGLIRWKSDLLDRRSRLYVLNPVAVGPITAWLAGVDIRTAGMWTLGAATARRDLAAPRGARVLDAIQDLDDY